MKKSKVAIVLINYRDYAKRFLKECYRSLEAQTDKDFDVFIADNETSKETQEFIKKTTPNAKIIPNKGNLGWAGGNNSAIKGNLDKYDYFILLNMDVVLDKDWLKELIEYIEKSDIAIAQSKIVIHEKNQINSLGNRIQYLGYGYCNAYGKGAHCTIEKEGCQIDYASGASMIVKSEVFKKIGLFREEFFMYHDDLEFCWRARLAGFNIGVAEKSVCHHKYSFGSTMNLIYFMERNRILTLFGLERIWSLILILPMLIPFEIAMLFYLALQGKFIPKLRAMFYPLTPTGIKLISSIRKEVKGYRVTSDKKIVKNFAGKVEFSEIQNPILEKIANPILNLYWKIVRTIIY